MYLDNSKNMSKIKEFFKFTWATFILLVIFNLLANLGILRWSGVFGKSVGAGIFDIFSFFTQFNCALPPNTLSITCNIWDTLLIVAIIVLNLFWQLFLANVVVLIYHKLKK